MTYTPPHIWYLKMIVGFVLMAAGMFMMYWPFRNATNNDGWMIVSGGTLIWIGSLWFL